VHTARFLWAAVAGADAYTLYVTRTDLQQTVLRAAGIVGKTYTPTDPLPHGINLRWKVKGEGCRAGPYSHDLTFMIGSPCVPPSVAPTALAPIDSGSTLPTFSWTAGPNAESYTLYVLQVSDSSELVHATGIVGTSYTPSTPLPAGIPLRWKVKGEAVCGPGPYGGANFTATGGAGGCGNGTCAAGVEDCG